LYIVIPKDKLDTPKKAAIYQSSMMPRKKWAERNGLGIQAVLFFKQGRTRIRRINQLVHLEVFAAKCFEPSTRGPDGACQKIFTGSWYYVPMRPKSLP